MYSACEQEHQLKICELALIHPHLPEMACVVAVSVHYQTAAHALLLLGMPVSWGDKSSCSSSCDKRAQCELVQHVSSSV
jgi:hypothetical protein